MWDSENDTEHTRTEINRSQTLVTSQLRYDVKYMYFVVEKKWHFEKFCYVLFNFEY